MHLIGTALTRRLARLTTAATAAAVVALPIVSLPQSHAASPVPVSSASSQELASAQQQISLYVDELGRPTPLSVQRTHEFANQPFVPLPVANALRTGIAFLAGSGEHGGPELPQSAPPFAQFLWPTVSFNCIGEGLHSTASAIAVPGPAEIPEPGAGPGQTSFIFTALGTPAAAAEQELMNVYWINLDSFHTGVTPLGNTGINPAGPATLSGTADTGYGHILAVVDGSVRTTENLCSFTPTAASFSVR